jgi:hypothetical protein
MFTIRRVGGVALLLAGSSWLWLTPAFASPGSSTSGVWWAITNVLCLLTTAGFCVATWALFTRRSWWEAFALRSAAVGLIAVVAYWVAAYEGGESVGTTTWNAFVHVLMVAGVFALLRIPQLERWVDHHVVSG